MHSILLCVLLCATTMTTSPTQSMLRAGWGTMRTAWLEYLACALGGQYTKGCSASVNMAAMLLETIS